MECPYIDKSILPNKINTPIKYQTSNGTDYIYWHHLCPDNKVIKVQFCKKIGRKQDIFECLNENEWKNCPTYKNAIRSNK